MDRSPVVDPADPEERLSYRLLTGTVDRAFCERVSQALAEGYQLYGSPAIATTGDEIVVGQAVILAANGGEARGA